MNGLADLFCSIMAAANHSQTCLDDVVGIKIVFWILNFLISSIVAYISFPIFYLLNRSPDLLAGIEKLHQDVRRLGPVIRRFTARWAFVTGIFASALISLQFKGLNVESAIFYGALGPFLLRDETLKSLRKGLQLNIWGMVHEADESVDKIPGEEMKSYNAMLDEIKKEAKRSKDR